ncbi:MAG: hypothetical protein EA385_12005 [Salinarimonadaceae bacterium]|nr:MAG: hypothetical protein EA385_12005 [Salinarimonadaceae bacterium]
MSERRDRLKSLKRIKAVQKQRHRMEEWRMVRARAQEADLRAAQEAVLDALNAEHPLHGMFLAGLGNRVGALGRAIEEAGLRSARQGALALEQARRLKVAEKFVREARREVEEEERREAFFDYLDQFAPGDGASLT